MAMMHGSFLSQRLQKCSAELNEGSGFLLKVIHGQEDSKAASEKTVAVAKKLQSMKLSQAAKTVENGFRETLICYHFPQQHWTRIRTNNTLERLMREIRRRTRVVGASPNGECAAMLVAARLRHAVGGKCGERVNLDMEIMMTSTIFHF